MRNESPPSAFKAAYVTSNDLVVALCSLESALEAEQTLFAKSLSYAMDNGLERSVVCFKLSENQMMRSLQERVSSEASKDDQCVVRKKWFSALGVAATESRAAIYTSLLCEGANLDINPLLQRSIGPFLSYLLLDQRLDPHVRKMIADTVAGLDETGSMELPASPVLTCSVDVRMATDGSSCLSGSDKGNPLKEAVTETKLVQAFLQTFALEINPSYQIDARARIPNPYTVVSKSPFAESKSSTSPGSSFLPDKVCLAALGASGSLGPSGSLGSSGIGTGAVFQARSFRKLALPKVNSRGIHNFPPRGLEKTSIPLGSKVYIQVALESHAVVPLTFSKMSVAFSLSNVSVSHLVASSTSSLLSIKRGLNVGGSQLNYALCFTVNETFVLQPGELLLVEIPWVCVVPGKLWLSSVKLFPHSPSSPLKHGSTPDDSIPNGSAPDSGGTGEGVPDGRDSHGRDPDGRDADGRDPDADGGLKHCLSGVDGCLSGVVLSADLSIMDSLPLHHLMAYELSLRGKLSRAFQAGALERMWKSPSLLDVTTARRYFTMQFRLVGDFAVVGDTATLILTIVSNDGFVLEQPPKIPIVATATRKGHYDRHLDDRHPDRGGVENRTGDATGDRTGDRGGGMDRGGVEKTTVGGVEKGGMEKSRRGKSGLPFKISIIWSQTKTISLDNKTLSEPSCRVLPIASGGEVMLSLPVFQKSISVLVPILIEQRAATPFVESVARLGAPSPGRAVSAARCNSADAQSSASPRKLRAAGSRYESQVTERRAAILIPAHARSPTVTSAGLRHTSYELFETPTLSPRSTCPTQAAELTVTSKIKALVGINLGPAEPEHQLTTERAELAALPALWDAHNAGSPRAGSPRVGGCARLRPGFAQTELSFASPFLGSPRPSTLSAHASAPERSVLVEETGTITIPVRPGLEADRFVVADTSTQYAEKLSVYWRGQGAIRLTKLVLQPPYCEPPGPDVPAVTHKFPRIQTHVLDAKEYLEQGNLHIEFPETERITLSGACPLDLMLLVDLAPSDPTPTGTTDLAPASNSGENCAATANCAPDVPGSGPHTSGAQTSAAALGETPSQEYVLELHYETPDNLPSAPKPLTIDRIRHPLATNLGQSTLIEMQLTNTTGCCAAVLYNLALPFDTPLDASFFAAGEREPEQTASWQVLGFKCRQLHVPPRSSVTVTFNLIAAVPGTLPLPPIQLSGTLLPNAAPDRPASADDRPAKALRPQGHPIQLSHCCWNTARIAVHPRWPNKCRLTLLGEDDDDDEEEAAF
ncbi:hypothetical protein GNI_089710 [Gregarina niphandrodes]|uniref:Uncharacterized protein n=1 Tax=Gregarina niphandrodes TaxID=110365 RepID=A0A023B5H4_GRENI|nr:hypothetical protein GNI_089710 [Gregarina niphandrodes]EZG61010.1 hypothetical protein GNI_089710 [Gregarina niphandrodes]|eukprot:XP_011130812.1 hypothetical protein GNI_089710 [Gregarina niphandrodes]